MATTPRNDLRRDPFFLPLQVGTTPSFGSAKCNQHIRRYGSRQSPIRHGIPQQVSGDEYIVVIGEENFQILLDFDNPVILFCVLCHRLAIALRIGVARINVG